MMSHVKVCFSTTYHILLAEFGELPIEIYARKLVMGFQQWLTHQSSSWLVSKAASLSQNMAKQGFNTWCKSIIMWKTSWGLYHWETHDNPTTSRRYFLLKSGTFSISLGRNYITSTSRIFLNMNVNCTQSNHRLAIEIGQWMITPISKDTRLCHFFSYNAVENEAHFMLE
jgi:hypothetical protein